MKLTRIVLALLFAAVAGSAAAQTFPSKPLRLIVPFGPGGPSDITGRLIALPIGETIGQPVVVENRPGAGGNIGAEIVARQAPDGYTLLLASTSFASNATLMRKLPYDPVKDFAPVGQVTIYPSIAVVHPSLPVKSVKELVALAKARPGQLVYGSAGIGTATHLVVELLKVAAGIDMLHVPYKSSVHARQDLLGGQIHLMFDAMAPALSLVKAGKLRAIAVTSRERSPLAPELPTVAEAGVPGFETAGWSGLFAPAATPADIVTRLNAALNKTLGSADLRKRLFELGFEPATSTPEQLGKFLRDEIDMWARLAKQGKLPLID